MMDWIRHFNQFSWAKHTEVQRRGGISLEAWFGCDHMNYSHEHRQRDILPDDVRPDDAQRLKTPVNERIYRLLLLDNFSGHHSLELYEYCMQFDIVLVYMPPHSSHFLQPMDVGVFLHLKDAHQRRLRHCIRRGDLTFTRQEFVRTFQAVWDAGFTRRHIIAGFTKSGIYPVNRDVVLEQIRDKYLPKVVTECPEHEHDEHRWRRSREVIDRIEERYLALMSSPTREKWRDLTTSVNEGQLAKQHLDRFAAERRRRLENLAAKRTRGLPIKSSGEVIARPSVSGSDLMAAAKRRDDAAYEQIKRDAQKARDRQWREDKKALRAKYDVWKRTPAGKIIKANGRPGRMKTFEEYLKETDNGDYIALDSRDPRYFANKPDDELFTLDVEPLDIPWLERPLSQYQPPQAPQVSDQADRLVIVFSDSDDDDDDDDDQDHGEIHSAEGGSASQDSPLASRSANEPVWKRMVRIARKGKAKMARKRMRKLAALNTMNNAAGSDMDVGNSGIDLPEVEINDYEGSEGDEVAVVMGSDDEGVDMADLEAPWFD